MIKVKKEVKISAQKPIILINKAGRISEGGNLFILQSIGGIHAENSDNAEKQRD
jgi:hypothetical protein